MVNITPKQRKIICQLNDPVYSVDFLEEWVSRDDHVTINAPAALQAMGAKGFFRAILAIQRLEGSNS